MSYFFITVLLLTVLYYQIREYNHKKEIKDLVVKNELLGYIERAAYIPNIFENQKNENFEELYYE